jgi:UDP-N-acetylglucosamine 2-epimerase
LTSSNDAVDRLPFLTIFTGTKAQFIKMLPVLLELERRGWPYRVIDTGQHAQLAEEVIAQYRIRPPDHSLAQNDAGAATLGEGLRWVAHLAKQLLRPAARLRQDLFEGQQGVCLVHGDTASTLLSTLIAKRAGQRVAHVEAGLRSFNYLHPFPEELVRVVVMRLADRLFAPNPGAMRNLEKMGLGDRSILLPGNTNRDILALAIERGATPVPDLPETYGVATIHRVESIYNRRSLKQSVEIVLKAHETTPMIWVEHPPTHKRLVAYGLHERLHRANVRLLPLQAHDRFVNLVRGARLLMTDGGSIQEEAYYLGVPCLLLRRATERDEGLGENVVLSRLDPTTVEEFLMNVDRYRRPERFEDADSPSRALVDSLPGS